MFANDLKSKSKSKSQTHTIYFLEYLSMYVLIAALSSVSSIKPFPSAALYSNRNSNALKVVQRSN